MSQVQRSVTSGAVSPISAVIGDPSQNNAGRPRPVDGEFGS